MRKIQSLVFCSGPASQHGQNSRQPYDGASETSDTGSSRIFSERTQFAPEIAGVQQHPCQAEQHRSRAKHITNVKIGDQAIGYGNCIQPPLAFFP